MIASAFLVSLTWGLLLWAPEPASAQNAQAPEYVGSNVCRTCHSGIYTDFTSNPHFKSIAAGNLPLSETGCESCHGPGAGPRARARRKRHDSQRVLAHAAQSDSGYLSQLSQ